MPGQVLAVRQELSLLEVVGVVQGEDLEMLVRYLRQELGDVGSLVGEE